jgi:hypothetical protein
VRVTETTPGGAVRLLAADKFLLADNKIHKWLDLRRRQLGCSHALRSPLDETAGRAHPSHHQRAR